MRSSSFRFLFSILSATLCKNKFLVIKLAVACMEYDASQKIVVEPKKKKRIG